MSDEEKVKEVFARVHDALDSAYDLAMGTVDEVWVKIDTFVGEWEKRTMEAVTGAGVKSEKVKVKPDVETMRDDLARHRQNVGLDGDVWRGISPERVEHWWYQLPEEFKSWVQRDKNSPL